MEVTYDEASQPGGNCDQLSNWRQTFLRDHQTKSMRLSLPRMPDISRASAHADETLNTSAKEGNSTGWRRDSSSNGGYEMVVVLNSPHSQDMAESTEIVALGNSWSYDYIGKEDNAEAPKPLSSYDSTEKSPERTPEVRKLNGDNFHFNSIPDGEFFPSGSQDRSDGSLASGIVQKVARNQREEFSASASAPWPLGKKKASNRYTLSGSMAGRRWTTNRWTKKLAKVSRQKNRCGWSPAPLPKEFGSWVDER